MSTYGTRSRTFLDISIETKQTCEDYQEPSGRKLIVRINDAEASIRFERRSRWSWYWNSGFLMIGTPVCFIEADVSQTFVTNVSTTGDYPEEKRN